MVSEKLTHGIPMKNPRYEGDEVHELRELVYDDNEMCKLEELK